MTVDRTLFGGASLGYCSYPASRTQRARWRLRREWQDLCRLPGRLHGRPVHLTDRTGTRTFFVARERGRWVLRPTFGRRSYRWLGRPLAAADGIAGELEAVAWAAEVLGVDVP